MFVKFQDLDACVLPTPIARGTRTLHALPKARSSEFCSASCLNVSQCNGIRCWALALIQQGQKPTAAANVPRRAAPREARNRATGLKLVYSARRKAAVGG